MRFKINRNQISCQNQLMPQGKKLTSKECVIENDYAIHLSFEVRSAKFWSKNAQMVSIIIFNYTFLGG